MITSIANTIVWLAFAYVAYVALTRYIATLPTSAKLRADFDALAAEHERAKLALTNLANKTREELEQIKNRQTQQAAASSIATKGPFR